MGRGEGRGGRRGVAVGHGRQGMTGPLSPFLFAKARLRAQVGEKGSPRRIKLPRIPGDPRINPARGGGERWAFWGWKGMRSPPGAPLKGPRRPGAEGAKGEVPPAPRGPPRGLWGRRERSRGAQAQGEVRMVPSHPTATKRPAPWVTPRSGEVVSEARAVQFTPSEEVRTVPSSPTATKRPDP